MITDVAIKVKDKFELNGLTFTYVDHKRYDCEVLATYIRKSFLLEVRQKIGSEHITTTLKYKDSEFPVASEYIREEVLSFIKRWATAHTKINSYEVFWNCFMLTQFRYLWEPKERRKEPSSIRSKMNMAQARYKRFDKRKYNEYLAKLIEKYGLGEAEIKLLTLREDGKLPEDLFFKRLKKRLGKQGFTVKRQHSVVFKGEKFKLDFLVTFQDKAVVIEHDGEYHASPKQKTKDRIRDLKVKAAMLPDFYKGVEIYRIPIGIAEFSFLNKLDDVIYFLTTEVDDG